MQKTIYIFKSVFLSSKYLEYHEEATRYISESKESVYKAVQDFIDEFSNLELDDIPDSAFMDTVFLEICEVPLDFVLNPYEGISTRQDSPIVAKGFLKNGHDNFSFVKTSSF